MKDHSQFVKPTVETLEDRVVPAVYSSTDVPVNIVDQATVTSTLSVADAVTVDDINVTLDISHTRDKDLDVFLIGPDNTRVELFTDVGGNGNNFTNTTLDDEAGTAITTGSAPFSGTFRPEGSLSDFDGKSANGTWTLEITDDQKRRTGTLNSWSIVVTSAAPPFSETTISFPDFSDATGLNLVGDAAIANGNVLRLTPAAGGMEGAAWYTAEKQFVSVGWETTFDFNLNENFDSPGGSDGFVFVVQNHDPGYLAGGGGTLGYHLLPNSLAVEFDTFQNSEVNDPSQSHISVHTNGTGPNSWDEALSLGSHNTPSIIDDAVTHTARIRYTPGTLTVFLDDLTNPVLTVSVDLADTLDLDSGRAWVGFTGTTGGGWQNHDILNWEYNVLADTSTTIAIDNAEVIEGDAGTTSIVFNVTRLGDTTGTSTANWVTANGTATAGSDYVADSGQVIFDPGVTEQTITITVNGDLAEEVHETFLINLTDADGGTIVVAKGTGTILNDDTSISIADTTVTEGDDSFVFLDAFVPANSGGLQRPGGITEGPDGNLYVKSSHTSHRILRFEKDTGNLIDEFVSPGSGGLDEIRSLVFGADGNLYVAADGPVNAVLRYDGTTGTFLDTFVSSGSGGLDEPRTMIFGPDGHLYVSNGPDGAVLRFDKDTGTPLPSVGNSDAYFVTSGSGGLAGAHGLAFGDDGRLYVSSAGTDEVLRFDGSTGVFIDTFVTAGSGGLDAPIGLLFGPDGNLYVNSARSDAVLRYNGTTGAFMDAVVPAGSGGLDNPRYSLFDAAGNLYVSSAETNEVLRYGAASQAVFTVSLSFPSAEQVTVDFDTEITAGSATAGSDYTATSGTLIFDPGVTTRTILVPTLDDSEEESAETFFVNLSNADGDTISVSQGQGTINDDDAPPPATKFYVVDTSADDTFEYRADGGLEESYNLDSDNSAPRGVAATAAGDTVWVIDNDDHVYVYDTSGTLLRSWKALGLSRPEGIATDGTAVWIVDRGNDRGHYFADGATRTTDTGATSSFSLAAGNPRGVTTDGTSLWVVDTGTDRVYKYTIAGTLLGSWSLDGANANPRGITIDPANVNDIWIVDVSTDKVYQYTGAASRTSGSQSATASFNLTSGNTNPQGIADPPPTSGFGVSQVQPVNTNQSSQHGPMLSESQDTPSAPTAFGGNPFGGIDYYLANMANDDVGFVQRNPVASDEANRDPEITGPVLPDEAEGDSTAENRDAVPGDQNSLVLPEVFARLEDELLEDNVLRPGSKLADFG